LKKLKNSCLKAAVLKKTINKITLYFKVYQLKILIAIKNRKAFLTKKTFLTKLILNSGGNQK